MTKHDMTKRELLGVLMAIGVASAAVAADPILVKPGVPLLFAEDSVVESMSNEVRIIHKAVKDKAPVLRPTLPCEGCHVCLFGSVHPKDGGGYRMWYMNGTYQMLIADSLDGTNWTKPELHVMDWKGDGGRNNISLDCSVQSVLDDKFEKDPSRRFKAIGCHYHKSGGVVDMEKTGYYTYESADGVHWKLGVRAASHFDTCSLAQNPRTGEILMYHKRYIPVPGYDPDCRRQVYLTRSRDFRHWSEPVPVIVPDAVDDGWRTDASQKTDFYSLTALAHAGGYVGFLPVFRMTNTIVNPDASKNQCGDDGDLFVEFATSRDGVKWNCAPGRPRVITAGAPGSFDGGCIPGVSSGGPGAVIHTPTETWMYYYAGPMTHGAGWKPGMEVTIGRARWRRWGFASLETWKFGEIVTKPLVLATDRVCLNAKPCRPGEQGAADVEILDAKTGKAITWATARGDKTLEPLKWRHPVPVGREVRIRMMPRYYAIYAVECL